MKPTQLAISTESFGVDDGSRLTLRADKNLVNTSRTSICMTRTPSNSHRHLDKVLGGSAEHHVDALVAFRRRPDTQMPTLPLLLLLRLPLSNRGPGFNTPKKNLELKMLT